MLRAITFDFWGTLADAGDSLKPDRVAFLCRYLRHYSPEQLGSAYDESWRQFLEALALGMGLSAATVLSTMLDVLGTSLAPQDYAVVLRYWEEAMLDDPPRLLDGAAEVLDTLRARGLSVGLISDTGITPGRVVRETLRRQGLLKMFDWLTFSNEIGVTKRRRQAFVYTLQGLHAHPTEAMHLGDFPAADVQGAHAVGMAAALVLESTGHREGIPEADLVVEYLRDLPEALAEWDRAHQIPL